MIECHYVQDVLTHLNYYMKCVKTFWTIYLYMLFLEYGSASLESPPISDTDSDSDAE